MSSGEVQVLRDRMVTLRDGVNLATDVYLPAGYRVGVDAPLPTILERTPYGKTELSRSEIGAGMDGPMARPQVAAHFVRAGYAVVYQDCRGRHSSEGVFTKYTSEGPDGYDTVAWITAQPWSNGKVGTMGLSYAAHTQFALACLNPPGLACMVVDSGGFSNAYHCGIRQGGAFELKQATWAFNQAKESPAALADPKVLAALEAEDLRAWFAAMPWRPGHSPVRAVPDYEAYLFEQWTNGSFGDYWKQLGIYAEGWYGTFPDIPIVLLSSWYDAYVRTTMENYAALTGNGRKGPVKLIMGPWLHGNRNTTFAGDTEFGPVATIDGNVTASWLDFRRRWFDRWLKGIGNGAEAEPAARLFLMGGGSGRRTAEGRLDHGGRWIAAADWPLPGTVFTDYHLHADGRLDAAAPEVEEASIAYQFDPANPVPTIGGALTSGQPVFEGGGFDQTEGERFFGCRRPGLPLSSRPDVVVFETEPLERDMAVVGPIEVRLFVSSDAPDTDFTAKLIDVHPPTADDPKGFALNLTDGILRCRYRDSWENPSPMEPGRVYAITIEPFATANLFKAGHRIRLDISSSNFPKYDVNPNSGEPEGTGRLKRVATNRIHLGRAHPSKIVLPVVPVESLTPVPKPGQG
ncbi:CocE/NonD family hydrolase [Inquilinus limosus]|uniref:CocE/NonD family hydrolase n=1 Tax=Inquilinus limosus TaxID=171674 RepID=UPI00047BDE62|nr:CocE/NonD family hydrolase [Inquilinus limosus]